LREDPHPVTCRKPCIDCNVGNAGNPDPVPQLARFGDRESKPSKHTKSPIATSCSARAPDSTDFRDGEAGLSPWEHEERDRERTVERWRAEDRTREAARAERKTNAYPNAVRFVSEYRNPDSSPIRR
jgi:hypothetical protein